MPYINNLDNYVPVVPFDGNEEDAELMNLLNHLLKLLDALKEGVKDIREANIEYLGFRGFLENKPEKSMAN